MPATAWSFLIGAVAICGLPPLNGFVSEFLVYLGLFSTLGDAQGPTLWGAAFAVPALAMIGALAVACFVKVYGVVFLGTARSDHARHAGESPLSMLVPMGALIVSCFVIGLAPLLVAPVLGNAVSAWAPELHDSDLRLLSLAPLGWVMVMNLALTAALFFAGAILWARLRIGVMEKGPTWGCGYIAPTPRMQYTSSSFAQMLVGLFSWALRPHVKTPNNMRLFPQRTEFHSEVPDTVLNDAMIPAFRFGAWLFSRFRVFQGGSIQAYLLYIFFALIALLLWR
jgi:hydrogenase-4 component B